MKKIWTYSNSNVQSTGTMVCCHCGEKITDGDYKYRISNSGYYVNRHRKCSPNDKQWAILDKNRIRYEQFKEECLEFCEKWELNYEDILEMY